MRLVSLANFFLVLKTSFWKWKKKKKNHPESLFQIDLDGLAFRISEWVPHRGSSLPKQRPH